jgi:hypothetical protein
MKVTVKVSTRKVGSECTTEFEIDDQEWRDMGDDDRENMARDAMWELVEWTYEAE